MDAKILFTVMVSVVLSAVAGLGLAWRYRRRVVALMSAASHGEPAAPALFSTPARAVPERFSGDSRQNAAARRRVAMVLVGISLLIGMSMSWFLLAFVYSYGGFGPLRVIVLGIVYSWMLVPALGMLWRWSILRTALATGVYLLGAIAIVWLASTAQQSLGNVVMWLSSQFAMPVAVTLFLAGSGTLRAASPYFFPVALVLVGSSVAGLDLLAAGMESPFSGVIVSLTGALGAWPVLLLFALVPWLAAIWPVRRAVDALAAAYRAKRYSEVIYLFGGYWFVTLLLYALPPTHAIGANAFWLLALWLWVPLGFGLFSRAARPPEPAPTLLVLRVFRRDRAAEALFDSVVERWRFSGNTMLIGASDLALRTLEPHELIEFVSGRLKERFVRDRTDLARRIAALDLAPDPDGRYRVNEFLCFDTTWQPTLTELVERSDVVLMDLRGFRRENRGCLHELGALAGARRPARVVVLYDGETDRAAAGDAAQGAPEGRFIWLDMSRPDAGRSRQVLEALLDIDSPGGH